MNKELSGYISKITTIKWNAVRLLKMKMMLVLLSFTFHHQKHT